MYMQKTQIKQVLINDGNIITFDNKNKKLAKEAMEACPFLLDSKKNTTATGVQSFSNHLNKKDPTREFFVNCDYRTGDKSWSSVSIMFGDRS